MRRPEACVPRLLCSIVQDATTTRERESERARERESERARERESERARERESERARERESERARERESERARERESERARERESNSTLKFGPVMRLHAGGGGEGISRCTTHRKNRFEGDYLQGLKPRTWRLQAVSR